MELKEARSEMSTKGTHSPVANFFFSSVSVKLKILCRKIFKRTSTNSTVNNGNGEFRFFRPSVMISMNYLVISLINNHLKFQ